MQAAPSSASWDPVVLIGAGLAGLTCAKVLAAAGQKFVLCEAADEVGGRVVSRTTAEGFVLDRGFQVLLDSYPLARRHLDLSALGGGRFRAGALFVGTGRPRALENPLRNPLAAGAGITGGILSWPDQLRLAALAASVLVRSAPPRDLSTLELLESWGFSEEFFVRFARPFFGGVLLDPGLGTSGSLLWGYLRRFATGRALLPGAGIGAIPAQLAARLPGESLKLRTPVVSIGLDDSGVSSVRLAGGGVLRSRRVVLAVDEPSACRLLGRGEARPAHSTAVHYFSAQSAWYEGAWLCLPPRREKQAVLHAALITNVAPTLAPPCRHLWSVTVLPEHPRAADADFVSHEVAGWFGRRGGELTPLEFVRVPYAVPEQPPGFSRRPAPWGDLPPGVVVVGDAVGGASIDAAMAGGEAAAKNLISSGWGS